MKIKLRDYEVHFHTAVFEFRNIKEGVNVEETEFFKELIKFLREWYPEKIINIYEDDIRVAVAVYDRVSFGTLYNSRVFMDKRFYKLKDMQPLCGDCPDIVKCARGEKKSCDRYIVWPAYLAEDSALLGFLKEWEEKSKEVKKDG